MQPILSKKEMTEEDIKLQYITPAVVSKWNRDKITMETPITDGQISLRGNLVFRKKPKKADYILYLCANHPIARRRAQRRSCTGKSRRKRSASFKRGKSRRKSPCRKL